MIEWSAERITGLSTEQIKDLKTNADKKGATEIVELCDQELLRRKPPRKKQVATPQRRGQFVSCFHFVCPKEKEVTRNQDGTIWSGTWVVSDENADMSQRYGGKVALHVSKAEPLYLQGVIKGWRRSLRQSEYADGIPVKTQYGIDFLLEPTAEQLQWVGDATGEKGTSGPRHRTQTWTRRPSQFKMFTLVNCRASLPAPRSSSPAASPAPAQSFAVSGSA